MSLNDELLDQEYAIWWITLHENQHLAKLPSDFGDKKGWPAYLSQAFNNRCGRWGACRILQSPLMTSRLPFATWPHQSDYEPYAQYCGVVVLARDLWRLHGMPGKFSNRSLMPIEIPKPPIVEERIVVPPPPPEPEPEPPKPQYPEPEPTVAEEPATPHESPKEETMRFGDESPSPKEVPGFIGKVLRNPIKSALIGLASIIGLCLLMSSFYTINETERGVVLAGGKLSKIEEPGIHFKLPGYHEVKRVSLQTWTDKFARLEAYSNDQQPASMQVSVTWSANPAMIAELYRTAIDLDQVTARFIRPKTPNEVENTFGKFTAEKLVQDRTQFVLALTESIRNNVPAFVQIESVQVENVNFSDAYEATIEEKAKAEVATATAGKKEARAVIDARAHVAQQQAFATAKKNQMIAEAEGIREKGKAEADAIIAKANALKNNPQLIQLIEAERWNGSRATTIYGAVSPMVEVK